ncbi:hypothetical protein SBOR_0483 [Sclerotinia borealis F-4128]|uniref:Uncharacterized protein n=1 Tax=Sclerotinia borealis (strain F-4128) TaxID=1432307 RepID=W9CSH1_SCLBF|nr:hypothetical protein SBOR_0483 [Sclerotinia borealis F-4128]
MGNYAPSRLIFKDPSAHAKTKHLVIPFCTIKGVNNSTERTSYIFPNSSTSHYSSTDNTRFFESSPSELCGIPFAALPNEFSRVHLSYISRRFFHFFPESFAFSDSDAIAIAIAIAVHELESGVWSPSEGGYSTPMYAVGDD